MGKVEEFNDAVYCEYIDTVSDLNEKFVVSTPWTCGDDNNPNTNGIFHSPHGYSFRAAYSKKDHAYILFASKGSANLRGDVADESGAVSPTQHGVENTYPIAAYRLKEYEGNKDKIFGFFAAAMKRFDAELTDRSRHTETNVVNFSAAPVCHHDIDGAYFGGGVEVMTNMKFYDVTRYDKTSGVVHHDLSVYRDDGHFKYNSYKKNFLRDGFSHASQVISSGADYIESRVLMDKVRRETDAKKYEQRDIHQGNGVVFASKAKFYSAVNYVHGHFNAVLANAAVVGGVYMMHPEYGPAAAFTSTVAHVAMHESAAEFVNNWGGMLGRFRHKFFGVNVKQKDFSENIAPLYKKGFSNVLLGRHEVYKFLPHADTDILKADDLVYVNDIDVLSLSEKVGAAFVSNMDDYALDCFILKQHQKNLPMKTYWLDRFTRGFEADNGVASILHKPPAGDTLTVYARLNPDLCVNPGLELPDGYKENFQDSIIKISVSKKDGNWVFDGSHEILNENEALSELYSVLFKHQNYVEDQFRELSYRCAKEMFFPQLHPIEALNLDRETKRDMKSVGVLTAPSRFSVLEERQYHLALARDEYKVDAGDDLNERLCAD